MDSYETLQNGGEQLNSRYGSQAGLKSDLCNGYTRDEFESMKPVKYRTTTFQDLNPDNLGELGRGINFNAGFGQTGELIDISSKLRDPRLSEKPCDGLGPTQLPTTAGFYRGHGNIEVENTKIRPNLTTNKKSCNPRETHYFNRTMQVFSNDIPSPYKYVDDFMTSNQWQYGAYTTSPEKKYSRTYSNAPEDYCDRRPFFSMDDK